MGHMRRRTATSIRRSLLCPTNLEVNLSRCCNSHAMGVYRQCTAWIPSIHLVQVIPLCRKLLRCDMLCCGMPYEPCLATYRAIRQGPDPVK